MEFLTQMVETDISKGMNELPGLRLKHYQPIPIKDGEYWLSIQASVFHHCWPRETFDDLNMYTSMEMALMDNHGEFLSITKILPEFTMLQDHYIHPIYSNAPVELIEELYQELKQHD